MYVYLYITDKKNTPYKFILHIIFDSNHVQTPNYLGLSFLILKYKFYIIYQYFYW